MVSTLTEKDTYRQRRAPASATVRGGDSHETTARQSQCQLAPTNLSFRMVQSNRRRLYVCEVSGHCPRRNVYPLSTGPGEEGAASSGVPGEARRGELGDETRLSNSDHRR